MSFESLIFDIDGTLWDSRALVAEGYNIQLRSEGYDHLCTDAETLKSLFGKVMTDIGDALLSEIPVPERYAVMERCIATENAHLEQDPCHIEYPNIKQVLSRLAENHRLFIVSNSQSGYPELVIRKMGLEELIRAHLCFGDTGTSKGQTIRRLMAEQGITSAIYIGDTQADLDACREAGIPFVFASYGFGQPDSWYARAECPEDLLTIFSPDAGGSV